ncbi:MAG: serine protease [Bacteroidia bacterium]|nr:serine protease [Bacteroidia bacterium]MBP7715449.1 serine protease [Bacteroidia bacterium]MBP8667532.1 serine protease [Bacteroidia bacterium]
MKKGILLLTMVLLNFTMTFGQKKVANYYSVKGYDEQTAKSYFDRFDIDPIEGIWQSNDGFKYSIEKDVENGMRQEGKYRVIILSHNTNNPFWKETYVKGFMEKTAANGVFNIDYYTAGRNYSGNTDIEIQTCIGLLEASALFTFTKQDGDKIILIKLYPKTENDNSGTFSSSNNVKSSGTGFAISSNGYIVTNHHVIENANSIEVKGVNGNFSRKLSAEIAVSDEKNDLAIIKINDPNFTTLGPVPYTFRQGIADVGENVFVLGYPMTSSMGEEIKLTNGIISSKTGFKGDISSYQVSAPVQPGNSGGPLFDKNGNLIGIVSAKHSLAENASYAVKVSYLKSLIELLPQSINQSTLNTLSGKGLTEQVKIASNYTYLIVINDKGNSYRSSNNNTTPKKSSTSEQNAEIYYQKAQELWENRDHKGALEQINLSIDASPNYAGSYYFRGFIYLYGIRNYEKAVDDFTKSIQMQSDFEEAYFFRGMAFHDLEKNIEAMKDFTKVISMNKENTDAYFMRALIKSNMNDKQGAISDYDEIIKREKSAEPSVYDMATVYNNKAYCLVELDKSNEALPFVNKALDLEKSLWYIWDTRGEIYYKLAQYNEAIKDMNKAIGIEEHDNSFYIRGLARIKLGQNESGCKDLSKAGELGEIKAYDAMKQHCK